MRISSFFLELQSPYQSEIDDLTFDSEGRDVLRQRLAEKRKELGFLLQMMELSPEMVAVVFHQGFRFKLPAVMDHLLSQESDEFPEWDSLSDAIQLTPWAQALADVVLENPVGEWFLTVAAGLEYMYSKPGAAAARHHDEDADEDDDNDDSYHDDGDDHLKSLDSDEARDEKTSGEPGGDWLVEQGFDRKD